MQIYEQKNRWKLILIFIALVIVSATLLYTNSLATKLAEEERQKVSQIAEVYRYLATAEDISDFGFFVSLIQANKTVPIISTDNSGEIVAFLNIDSVKVVHDSTYLTKRLKEMKDFADPIQFEISGGIYQYIYYQHSDLYQQLLYYPYVQLMIIAIFLIVAYTLFNTARRSEQNRVWVGMAKETAHQLGTPISSLAAWVEYLENIPELQSKGSVLQEMDKDVQRLVLIADRFSKVGSQPDITPVDLVTELDKSIDYIKRRSSQKAQFFFHPPVDHPKVRMNVILFNWVIENLLKNALDAMEGEGEITIDLTHDAQHAIIDVSDTGKGIPRSKQQTVFEPGYSTKKRGWGLGLTLAKRIVESYHKGKIFVKQSTPGKGTTFRIMLPLS